MTFAVRVTRLQGYGLFQPFLRILKPVGKQCNAAQLEGCRIMLGILSDDLRVKFASFSKLPRLKEPIGRIDFRLPGLRCRLSEEARGRDNRSEGDASPGKFHLGFWKQSYCAQRSPYTFP